MSACAATVMIVTSMFSEPEKVENVWFPECSPEPPAVCLQIGKNHPWQPAHLRCVDKNDKIVFAGAVWFPERKV